MLLYALGAYTPAFQLMYDLLPAVALYRRPADATFVLVALIALIAGYLVHRWLTGTVTLGLAALDLRSQRGRREMMNAECGMMNEKIQAA